MKRHPPGLCLFMSRPSADLSAGSVLWPDRPPELSTNEHFPPTNARESGIGRESGPPTEALADLLT